MKEKYSVFEGVGYRPRYYLRHPIKWVSLKCRQIKWAYQRAVYGWCESDSWDIDSWYLKVMPNLLRHFAANTHTFPGNTEFPTYESWVTKLNEVADAIEGYDESKWDEKNEYYEEYMKEIKNWQWKEEDTPMSRGLVPIYTKYRERDKELAANAYVQFDIAMRWIIEHFHHLWD